MVTSGGIPGRGRGRSWRLGALALESREDAMRWMINNQLGRRNLTVEQKSYLRGQRDNLETRQDLGHGPQKASGENPRPMRSPSRPRAGRVNFPLAYRRTKFYDARVLEAEKAKPW
jgi:hypothetical protein